MARYREIWQIFPMLAFVELVTPRGGAKFDPDALHWALLVEAHKIKKHAKFGKPRPYG